MKLAWFIALVSTICLEGLGRKYLPGIPSAFFYLAKDLVLVIGFWMFRPSPTIIPTGSRLYSGFKVVWLLGIFWTVGELLNPRQLSLPIGFLGLRAYWLWWFAPLVVAFRFRELDDAIRQVNKSFFGLQTGIFTNDLAGAWKAFHELEVGGVIVNDVPTYRIDNMPYGGVKDSGMGREGIRWAIEDMTEIRIMVMAQPQ